MPGAGQEPNEGEWLDLTPRKAQKRYITCRDLRMYDDWLPQVYYHAIMQQLHVSGHMKEFAELFDRVKGFNNLEMRDRVCPT